MIIITVARNIKMYNELVKDNIFNKNAEFIFYDNNHENIAITKRYNCFLDNYNYDNEDWFIFCHEDWQVMESWQNHIKNLEKNSIYGVCGTKIVINNDYGKHYFLGRIENCRKDGSGLKSIGKRVKTGAEVDTFDCMCMIMHSSLVKKYNIRFDENLTWHLYSEELSIRLSEDYGVKSRILQIKCKHWSYGMHDENFGLTYNYIADKFQNAGKLYSATVFDYIGGPAKPLKTKNILGQSFRHFLFQTRISSSGKKRIKIFGITVMSMKAKR